MNEITELTKVRQIPAEYIPVLGAAQIINTVSELDAGIQDILLSGQAKEATYQCKSDLLKARWKLETEVKITEADAIMQIRGEARSQYVMVGEEKVALNNDTARDAYRRMAAKDQRVELARVNGEIAALDADLSKANDSWQASKDANDSIRAKAAVQASLLNFLSN